MKFRILHYHRYLKFETGSPKAIAHFIESLDRTIFEPVFCAAEDGPLVRALAARGTDIVKGSAGGVSFRHPFAALAAIRRQAANLRSWKTDLLHAHGLDWNIDLILAAWLLRIPIIVHIQNPVSIDRCNLVPLAARKLLFCSRNLMYGTRHFDRIAHKAEPLYNIIDTAHVGRGVSIREKLGVKPAEIAIGTVAQICQRKGIDIILETARILLRERNDLVFLIAGPLVAEEREFVERMQQAAQAPALCGRVRLLGVRSDIPDFLASLDLFLFPSRAEPFGIAVIEAMAAGLPVIAARVGGIPEIIDSPALGRLVDESAPEAFANAVREILTLPDKGRSIGDQAQRSVTARFDTAVGGERLRQIYLSLLETKTRHQKGLATI